MNPRRSTPDWQRAAAVRPQRERRAFTLLEVLVVISIIGILIGAMGGVINNSFRKARESATTALILKIDGSLDERIKGFERATKSRDFQRIVATRKQALEAAGLFGVSPKVIEAVARKDFYRLNFPQRFEELPPYTTALPAIIASDPQINYIAANHARRTESAALLYYMLTKMQAFGVPPVGESEFGTSEFRDTDNDGLLEFVDGWGRPLRFYRWPTRLIKPNGAWGNDGQWGAGGSSFAAYGALGTDDVSLGLPPPTVPLDIRPIAGLLIEGLVRRPAFPLQQWDSLSEDPEDPYGLISTELKRLLATGVDMTPSSTNAARYAEPLYPTLDTYHTPLIVSVGPDGSRPGYQDNGPDSDIETGLGLFEPWETGAAALGVLAQPRHGGGGPYDIQSDVISALTDNLTNRNRRAGRGK